MALHHSQTFFNVVIFRTLSSSSRTKNLEILGLPEDASAHQIKAAYLRLSKELHPDVNSSDTATEEFQRVKTAYDQLLSSQTKNVAGSPSASPSSSSEEERRESWKARQRRTREFDDWLRKVQNDGRRQKAKRPRFGEDEEELKAKYSETDFTEFREKFSKFKFDEEKAGKPQSHHDEAYLRYEKNFIARLDYFLGLQSKLNPEYNIQDHINRRKDLTLSLLAPFIWRLLIRSIVYVSLAVFCISSALGRSTY